MRYNNGRTRFRKPLVWILLSFCGVAFAYAQESLSLVDDPSVFSAYKDRPPGWKAVGDVRINLKKPSQLVVDKGNGVLAYIAEKGSQASMLVTAKSYNDFYLETDFLLTEGAKIKIAIHEHYYLQLGDDKESHPIASANGQITGHAPRQQVGRAPGLWQHLRLSFRAPQFDRATGETVPARLLFAELNNALIYEDVRLTSDEKTGDVQNAPLRIIAEAGSIALRNTSIMPSGDKAISPAMKESNADPIWVDAPVNTVLRSFMNLPDTNRITHAISVGHPEQTHYTYDLSTGHLVQAWRGGFLDATPMWHNRGNGTSRPLGSLIYFGRPLPEVARLESPDAAWPLDTTGSGFRTRGYTLDQYDLPVFHYELTGTSVTDAIRPLPEGNGFRRTFQIQNTGEAIYLRLARSRQIRQQDKEVYLIGDNAWYLHLRDTNGARPIIRNSGEEKELIIPVKSSITYSIMF